jgi:hypothetical protein
MNVIEEPVRACGVEFARDAEQSAGAALVRGESGRIRLGRSEDRRSCLGDHDIDDP